jgi:hypothetical protein
MEAAPAAELFQKYAKISRYDAGVEGAMLPVVRELGCLALAVTLAPTYVGSTPRLQNTKSSESDEGRDCTKLRL